VLPSREDFPYAIRQVSEALSSNGSTSMGSVCASTLSMLNAGVPLKAPVAGLAMGLISDEVDGEMRYAALTDILGAEDEFGDMDPRAWVEVIRPALADREGWAIFIGTPKGRNEFHKLYEHAKTAPNWEAFMLKASDSDLIAPAELADARAIMTADQYAQEFECSFEAAIQGAFFAEEFRLIDADKRIRNVPWQAGQRVYTAWDLGIDDATAIWFFQMAGQEIHLIDFMEISGEGLPAIVKRLDKKPYTFEEHFLPHDAEARELGTGETRRHTLQGLMGSKQRITVLPQQNIEDGIHAARMIMPRCYFDTEKTARGIECLRQYRREFDEKLKVFRSRPLHDWSSHAADAFRYLAMGMTRISASSPPKMTIPDYGAA
jgi:hypothetical protein